MGGAWKRCRVLVLAVLALDSTLVAVNAARQVGGAVSKAPVPLLSVAQAATPPSSGVDVREHYRAPLLDLCASKEHASVDDLRAVAPEVFLRLLRDKNWQSALLGSQGDMAAALGKVLAEHVEDPGFSASMGCEAKVLKSAFPALGEFLSDTTAANNITAERVSGLLASVNDAVRASIGSSLQMAKSYNLLQEKVAALDPSAAKLERLDAVQLLQEVQEAHSTAAALDTVEHVQRESLLGSAKGTLHERYNDQPVPPNDGLVNARAKQLQQIDYDSFARSVLTIVRVNSGVILLLCFMTIATEMFNSVARDSEAQFILRDQLRQGKWAVGDTASVERDPHVGASSAVLGTAALDQLLYGAVYPLKNKIPDPKHINEKDLKMSLQKGNDKILYQTMSASARRQFKSLFKHEPALGVFEGDVLGPITDPPGAVDKLMGSYTASPEMLGFDLAGNRLGLLEDNGQGGVTGKLLKREFLEQHPKLMSHFTARDHALEVKDVAGFVGSLKMKVLRSMLDSRGGDVDPELRKLRVAAMEEGMVSVTDVVELLLYYDDSNDALGEGRVKHVLKNLLEAVLHSGTKVCYYGGALPAALASFRAALSEPGDDYSGGGSLALALDTNAEPACPKIDLQEAPGSLFVKLADVARLPMIQELSELIDSQAFEYGMTPGQQLKLAQVNTGDRLEKLFHSISTVARVNFAMLIIKYLGDAFGRANSLYQLSKASCEDRDADDVNIFWGAPIPGPACPKFGVAFFPEWINWLASPNSTIALGANDLVGSTVEYDCLTANKPDPTRRQMVLDDAHANARLLGSMPSCIQEPSAYTCSFRTASYLTQQCSANLNTTDLRVAGTYDGVDLLDHTLGYTPIQGTSEAVAQFKVMSRFQAEGQTKLGAPSLPDFHCTENAGVATLPETYQVFEPNEADLATQTMVSYCHNLCVKTSCEAFFYVHRTSGAKLCFTLPTMKFPINQALDRTVISEAGVCYKDLGLRLALFTEQLAPVAEIRIKETKAQLVDPSGAVMANSYVGDVGLLQPGRFRYLDIMIRKGVGSDGKTTNTLAITPMIRLDSHEENFKWLRQQDSILFHTFPGSAVSRVGIGCSDYVEVKDTCFRKANFADEFIYPSEPWTSIIPDKLELAQEPAMLLVETAAHAQQRQEEGQQQGDKPGAVDQAPATSMVGKLEEMLSTEAHDAAQVLARIPGTPVSPLWLMQEVLKGPSNWATIGQAVGQLWFHPDRAQQQLLVSLAEKVSLSPPSVGIFRFIEQPQFERFTRKISDFAAGVSQRRSLDERLGAQSLLQDPPSVIMTHAAGPIKAANDLLFLYGIGCLFAMVFMLIKNKDRVNPENNIARGMGEMFNPAYAIVPDGEFAQAYGSPAQSTVLMLFFISFSSFVSALMNIRTTMTEASKANDIMMGLE